MRSTRLVTLLAACGFFVASGPATACLPWDRATAEMAGGRWQAAIEAYQQALDVCGLDRPDRAAMIYGIGLAYDRSRDLDSALYYYEEAIAVDGSLTPAHSSRCYILQETGRVDEALVSCDTALRLDPDHAPAYAIRATIRADRGERQAALADFAEAIRLTPDNWMLYYNRAHSRDAWGESAAAGEDLDEAWARAPAWARDSMDLFARYGTGN